MKVVIYDENNLDSTLATACYTSISRVKVFEAKEVIIDFPENEIEEYIWVGVFPTRTHFANKFDGSYLKTKHTAILNSYSTKHDDLVPNVKFIHCRNEDFHYEPFSYGEKTLVERLTASENINPENFIGVISLIKEFEKNNTDIEDIMFTVLNMKEASLCLKQNSPYQFIPFSEKFLEAAKEAYEEISSDAKDIIDNRSIIDKIVDKKDFKPFKLYSFYEQRNFWFIRKLMDNAKTKYRNISVSATGVAILSNVEIKSAVNFPGSVNLK